MTQGRRTEGEAQVEALGPALRHRRKALNLTMQNVAEAAGLSVGFISQVERGLTIPSLTSLSGIARALGVPVGQFLGAPREAAAVLWTRQGERAHFSIAAGRVRYERLSAGFPGSQLTSVIVHEPPGASREPTTHPGEEMIYVISGALTAQVEDETTILSAGDSIHFASSRPHAAWNHTDADTVVLWCGTVDVFGSDGPDPIHRQGAG